MMFRGNERNYPITEKNIVIPIYILHIFDLQIILKNATFRG